MRSATRVTSVCTAVAGSQLRHYFDTTGHQGEGLFLDRKDIEQMYPTRKPRVTAGEYGYQRGAYWNIFGTPNPGKRLPHERRKLNPLPARIVTIFGASGYLGSRIARELLKDENIQCVRLTTRYPTLIKEGSDLDKLLTENGDRVELHECDVTDRIQVNVAANGADTLIFAIDFFNEYADNSHHDVFVQGTHNVSWTARAVRAERVIYCNGLDATFASESSYVDMRARGEDACAANFPDSTLLRFGPLYGEGYRHRGAAKFIYPCTWPITLAQPTWVEDAARAVARCCFAKKAIRFKLDLGGPETMTHLDFERKRSQLWQRRLVFPFPTWLGRLFTRCAPWIFPNPWFDDNWFLVWELDMVNRNRAMFERLGSWDIIGLKPHTINEAYAVERGDLEIKTMKELNDEYREVEKADEDAFKREEEEAAKKGVLRGKAEPAHGRGDGMETLAEEIYPNSFRLKPLKDAKYPEKAKMPAGMTAGKKEWGKPMIVTGSAVEHPRQGKGKTPLPASIVPK